MNSTVHVLKLLADATRLRILHLLGIEELSVAELQEILGMGQSRISSHLALLRKGKILIDRKDGKKTFYSIDPNLPESDAKLIKTACNGNMEDKLTADDLAQLKRILENRRRKSEDYFNTIAGKLGKNYCPGRSWEAIAYALFYLTPHITIADLGAGEGMISQLLARRAKKVYCIDKSVRMVKVGSELAKANHLDNVEYLLGDIESVPLKAKSVDFAILSQALHHADHPQAAINEAFRILKDGGSILILDLHEHNFERAHELYADRWLGFSKNTIYSMLKNAGFTGIEVNTVAREDKAPHFETILASAKKRD